MSTKRGDKIDELLKTLFHNENQVLSVNFRAKNQLFYKFWIWFQEKNSWKFVYFLAKQCKTPFNLTIFFNQIFKNFLLVIHPKHIATYCIFLAWKFKWDILNDFFQKIVFLKTTVKLIIITEKMYFSRAQKSIVWKNIFFRNYSQSISRLL